MEPSPPLNLTDDERSVLEAWAAQRSESSSNRRALRASIVLAYASGLCTHDVAMRLCVRTSTAAKWRDRYVQHRLEGLEDRPRSGAPRRISDASLADVLERIREPTPPGARPWSRRLIAEATGLSRSTIHRIWRAFDIAGVSR